MSGPYASANGRRIVTGRLTMDSFAGWVADIFLADPDDLDGSGSVTLVLANLTLVGAVVRQDDYAGQRRARLVAGAGGWRKTVAARAYQNPLGVQASIVARDAALEVGESIVVPTDKDYSVGTDFVREACPAVRVLRQLFGRTWWIDVDGTTQLKNRGSSRVTSDFTVTNYDGARGLLTVASEDVAAWLPGATFSNALIQPALTVSALSVETENTGKLRIDVMVD